MLRSADRAVESEVVAEAPVRQAVEDSFIQYILNPYAAKRCIYLKSASHLFEGRSSGSRATFSIPDSCYIDNTGHFNAVELNICYNQMFYLLWADGIRRQAIPEVADWNVSHFKARQLPNMLIVRLKSDFRRPIAALSFRAEGSIDKIRVMGKATNPTLFVRTHASFADGQGGLANGEVDFAVIP